MPGLEHDGPTSSSCRGSVDLLCECSDCTLDEGSNDRETLCLIVEAGKDKVLNRCSVGGRVGVDGKVIESVEYRQRICDGYWTSVCKVPLLVQGAGRSIRLVETESL